MYSHCKAGYGPAHRQHRAAFYTNRFREEVPFRRPKHNVPVNIIDREGAFEVHVYALGFAREAMTLSVADDLLTISGTRDLDEAQQPDFLRQEYPIKSFERIIRLNGKVAIADISAKQVDGGTHRDTA